MPATAESTIRCGRAYIRIIEAIDLLLANDGQSRDLEALTTFRALASHRLKRIMGSLDAAGATQVLAASDRLWSLVNDITLN